MYTIFDCLGHSTIRINYNNFIIYVDPFNINKANNDADLILITHSHYDHFSLNDILKIKKEETKIVITKDMYQDILELNFLDSNIICVNPNDRIYINDIDINTIPAYNINKPFHPKDKGWVGYILSINKKKYYIAGDTDITDENIKVICDVAFIPVGGIYTMNYIEAAKLTNIISPKIAVPIHYGSIVGDKGDAIKYKKLLNNNINCKIFY